MRILDEVDEMTFVDGIRDVGFTNEVVKFSMFQTMARAKSMEDIEICSVMKHKVVMTHATAIEFAAQLNALLTQINSKNENEEEARN